MENKVLLKIMLVILISIYSLSGCASLPKQMSLVTIPTDINSNDNSAKIVFYRPFNVAGSAINTQIIRISEDKNVFYVGELAAGQGVIHTVRAGKHIFGVSGEWWRSLTVEAEENKFYYVLLSAAPGFFVANFNITLVDKENSKYFDKLNAIEWVYPNDMAISYINNNANKFYNLWVSAINRKRIIYMDKSYGFDSWMLKKEETKK